MSSPESTAQDDDYIEHPAITIGVPQVTPTAPITIQTPSAEKSNNALPYRSRTDSTISYGAGATPEAPGATFYINRKGEMDLVVLLKVNIDRERVFVRRKKHRR